MSDHCRRINRSCELEQAYVHDVYSKIAARQLPLYPTPVPAHVKHFVSEELACGALLLDVGCGARRSIRSDVFAVGIDRCAAWFDNENSNRTNNECAAAVADVFRQPFRDETFDAALVCEILHHISRYERRLCALHEIARVLKVSNTVYCTQTQY